MRKNISIVTEGQWGTQVTPQDYQAEAEILQLILIKEANRVDIVETALEAEMQVARGLADVVVFLTRGMEQQAKAMARLHPNTRVIVFTGLVPKGEVVWAAKPWAMDINMAPKIVLFS